MREVMQNGCVSTQGITFALRYALRDAGGSLLLKIITLPDLYQREPDGICPLSSNSAAFPFMGVQSGVRPLVPLITYGCEQCVLGIETSCDDTGAAVVSGAGKVLGEALHNQHSVHLRRLSEHVYKTRPSHTTRRIAYTVRHENGVYTVCVVVFVTSMGLLRREFILELKQFFFHYSF
ncbi:putative tRNA N6-adenosine threonylcarbamoyltransferase, mitochondrial [Chionoecetes opilio]|uniref:Putative tRNA N6-adenosine threonylcarbamoyltransferase, mitochondrial n=1 Tax=Chionoecetes opilio TaxID=41210 RepID=A0A8J5CN80_CHIOP|nr:putative tRNA N6-adenosine threonylcarbamoyltransferase, mitochondrial [Chionoecetes opilio]